MFTPEETATLTEKTLAGTGVNGKTVVGTRFKDPTVAVRRGIT
jgi:hypothetical protein